MVKGKSLEWGEDELEALSEISPSDVEAAAVWWKTNAPKEAKDILDAEADVPLE